MVNIDTRSWLAVHPLARVKNSVHHFIVEKKPPLVLSCPIHSILKKTTTYITGKLYKYICFCIPLETGMHTFVLLKLQHFMASFWTFEIHNLPPYIHEYMPNQNKETVLVYY